MNEEICLCNDCLLRHCCIVPASMQVGFGPMNTMRPLQRRHPMLRLPGSRERQRSIRAFGADDRGRQKYHPQVNRLATRPSFGATSSSSPTSSPNQARVGTRRRPRLPLDLTRVSELATAYSCSRSLARARSSGTGKTPLLVLQLAQRHD